MADLRKEIMIMFGGAISASLKSSISGLSAGLGKIKSSVLSVNGALAGLGVGSVFAKVVSATNEQADAMKQVNAAIASTGGVAGYTADELAKMASELQSVTIYGDDAVLGADKILLTFTNVRRGGEIYKDALVSILDISARMGQDLQSSAVQIGKALNDPINGLTALTRVGVSFTQKQKDQIKTLAESGRVMEAQRMILAKLKTEFGGSASIKTFGDQLTAVGNAFGDLFEGTGELRPALTDLIAVLQDPATVSAAGDLANGLISIASAAISATSDVVTFFRNGVSQFKVWSAQKEFESAKLGYEQAAAEMQRAAAGVTGSMDGGVFGVIPAAMAKQNFDAAKARFDAAATRVAGTTASGAAAPPPAGSGGRNSVSAPTGSGPTKTAKTPIAARTQDAETDLEHTRAIVRAEAGIWAAHQLEMNAISAKSAEAQARYQKQQEQYLADLTAAGASKERVDMLSKIVGEATADPNAQIKFHATIDPADLAGMPASIQAALKSGQYEITYQANVLVIPTLITSAAADAVQKQVDASGTQGE